MMLHTVKGVKLNTLQIIGLVAVFLVAIIAIIFYTGFGNFSLTVDNSEFEVKEAKAFAKFFALAFGLGFVAGWIAYWMFMVDK